MADKLGSLMVVMLVEVIHLLTKIGIHGGQLGILVFHAFGDLVLEFYFNTFVDKVLITVGSCDSFGEFVASEG